MSRGEKSYAGLISIAVFIFLEIVSISLLKVSAPMQNIWLNRLSHRTIARLWGEGVKISSYFSLTRQNEELAEEVYRLTGELQKYKSAAIDMAIRDSLKGISDNRFVYIPAQVIKASRNNQHNYIILNKGYEDGITPHSGIITGDGIVGIIDAVDRHLSYGLTLMNNRISVSVRTGKGGPVTPLVWNGKTSDGALLKDLPIHGTYVQGDTVRTSGLSSVFPGDLPVGVTGAFKSRSGTAGEMEVKLFQDFSMLKYVIVTSDPDRGEINRMEKEAER